MPDDLDKTRLAKLFDSSPDAIIVVDMDGEIIRANDRIEDLFGYEPAEIEGEPVERLVPEPHREDHPEKREAYMADPAARPMGADLDLYAQRKDGSTFPVDISLSPLDTDDGIEVMAAIRDITERETLRRKYQTVMETAPDAMFVVDAETGEILEINRRAAELVGMSEDELIGKDQTVLHPSEDEEWYRDLFRQHASEKEGAVIQSPEGKDIYIETTTGERIPVEISAQTTSLSGRKVVVGVFRDITAQKEYERELHRQIERLEKLAEVLSHDLRNPLNVAEAGVDIAKRTGDLDRLESVETAHSRMEQLIDDALILIREGYEVESVEPLELDTIVSECWQNVRTPDATVHVVSDGIVYADSRRIKSLFENLFRNAVEHGSTSPDSHARQDAVEHGGESVTVRVGVYDDGFFVADDGPGIPEEDRENVLQPGWTTDESGTGLGLNIVAEIAAAHDWDISVSESDDGGARFDFTGVRTVVYDRSFEP